MINLDDTEVAMIFNTDGSVRFELVQPETEEEARELMCLYSVAYGLALKMKNNDEFVKQMQELGARSLVSQHDNEDGRGTLQ